MFNLIRLRKTILSQPSTLTAEITGDIFKSKANNLILIMMCGEVSRQGFLKDIPEINSWSR
jgi:hypothetical protein